MKFFTPELLGRFASDDYEVALAAQEQLEQRYDQYGRHWQEIVSRLPQRFREMRDRFYLHDARATSPFLPRMVNCSSGNQTQTSAAPNGWLPSQIGLESSPSFWMVLQLDAPPHEFLVLHYRFVKIEEACHAVNEEICPYLEWQADEVDLVPSEPDFPFLHSILLTNGFEVQLQFRDFDFATLKPLDAPPKQKRTHRQKTPSE